MTRSKSAKSAKEKSSKSDAKPKIVNSLSQKARDSLAGKIPDRWKPKPKKPNLRPYTE